MSDTPEKLEPKPTPDHEDGDKMTVKRANTVVIDAEAIKADESRQQEAEELNKKKIAGAINETAAYSLDARTETSRDVAQEVLLSPLNKLTKQWENRRNDLYTRAQKGEHITYADLMRSTSEIEKQMQDTAGIITAYIFEMAAKSSDGKLSPEALAEIKYSINKNAVKMAEMAMKQKDAPELVEAMKFVLKIEKIDKVKVFDTLSKIIFGKSDLSAYAWTVLSFMDENSQIEFGKFYIEKNKLSPVDAQKFLDTWSVQGNISIETMRKILANSKIDTKAFEQKAQEYARNWKAKNDFVEKAKQMAEVSYGATNQATDMMTPTGVLTFMANVWSVGTIALNVGTTVFYGGKINNPEFIIGSLAENPWFITGIGTLAAIKATEKGGIGSALRSKEEVQNQEEASAKKEFKYLVAGNLELEAFLKSGNTYEGSRKFFDYLQYVRREKGSEDMPFPEKEMTKSAFLKWLSSNFAKANSAEQDKILIVMKALQKNKISDKEFYRLAVPFDKLAIGGIEAEKNYLKALA